MNPFARLKHSLQTHGLPGTVRLAGGLLARSALKPLQRWWVSRYYRITGLRFDRRFHVDTTGWIDGKNLDGGANVRHATAYAGVAPRPFHEVLAQLSIDFEKFTFIDFGSGKGRALMLASEYPFAKIIGVDFSPRLNGIAEANLRAYQNPARQCSAIELKCMDATEYEIPAEPAVLFFFNPFGEDLTRLIAKKLQASLQDYPRAVLVVYFWPTARKAWDELGTLQSVSVRQPAWAWPAHRGREIVAVWRTQAET